MDWLFARFAEPSTFAGIAGIALAVAQAFPETAPVVHVVSWIAGLLAVGVSEKSKTPSA